MTVVRRWWSKRNARRTQKHLALQQVAHAAQVEVVRTMPFNARDTGLLTAEMRDAARQSVRDSAALQAVVAELYAHTDLPENLKEAARTVLEALDRLVQLRESWMRHWPEMEETEETSGLPGMRLMQRVERGALRSAVAPGPWSDDEEAQAAMQVALPHLERLHEELCRFSGIDLVATPPVGS